MTTQTHNTQAKYFDLHTQGVGYINRFREIQPKSKKSQSFCAVTIAFLRGSSDDVEYTYVDTIIRNKEVCELLKANQDAINDESKKVLGVVTVGDIYPDTFTTGEGKVLPTIKGRLIGMKQLTVNGEVVFKKEPSKANDDQPVEQDGNQEAAPQAQAEENNDANPADLPTSVTLDPNAPDFAAQRDALKDQGYSWNSVNKTWDLSAA